MIYKNKLIETIQYKVDAVTVSPLSIKDGDDNLKLDNTTGKFYIPGSSVAGAFRNYYENYINNHMHHENNLFGGTDTGMNKLVCYDAFAAGQQIISSRPGLRIDRRTLTDYRFFSAGKKVGSKFKRHFLNDGVRFIFVFELNNYNGVDGFENIKSQFELLLAAFSAGDILLGNNKMIGFGRFEVNSVHKTEYNLCKYEDVYNYLLKKRHYIDITELILNNKSDLKNVRFKIKAKTTTPVLIKDEVVRSSREPDGINLKNSNNEYIIPGSSLKGVLRARAEKLAKTFPCINSKVLTNIFGVESNNEDEAHISRFVCYDTIIKNAAIGIYNKVKIDYFTGGVQKHALMSEETVMGDLEIECAFNTFGLEQYDKEIGLLLLVLRDLCTENLNVGGGYAVGRGYIKADTLELIHGQKMIYNFNSPDKLVEEQFNSYISKLMVG
ncbi:MAG: hypothetical protein GX286_01470 [Clostridiales bacterium]|jgi:CRISPR/Cas system CSM-associated protein Csm3 (group 7 of RAMP superfamily)|nr:hypothetical protein [Clostridiales bacterium]